MKIYFLPAFLMASACGQHGSVEINGLSLLVRDEGGAVVEIEILNARDNDAIINGFVFPGASQSVVKFERTDSGSLNHMDNRRAMPIIVDLESYKMRLLEGASYKVVAPKSGLAKMLGLERGSCAPVRFTYVPPDKSYDFFEQSSVTIKLCIR